MMVIIIILVSYAPTLARNSRQENEEYQRNDNNRNDNYQSYMENNAETNNQGLKRNAHIITIQRKHEQSCQAIK